MTLEEIVEKFEIKVSTQGCLSVLDHESEYLFKTQEYFDLPNWLTEEETIQVLTERGYIDEEE